MSVVAARVRTRARIQGTVQGVGFRPFVFRLAGEERVAGWVLNDEHGVLLEVEGDPPAVQRFLSRLRADAPPLAHIDAVTAEPLTPRGEHEFRILTSERTGAPDALITPDSATCPDCLAELADPGDRRYRYPFINCTNCGPRFTIVRGVPYDRPLTTMAAFAMCPSCRGEYEDPSDRRFHAQPNACPVCGPRVRALACDGCEAHIGDARDAIEHAARTLAAGAVVAIKGLGGYHLACDAADQAAVRALRTRKHREDKPFALMVASAAAAQALVMLEPDSQAELVSVQRPIVLAPRRPDARIADAVAPGSPELGIMLPYTPLHHLLLADFIAASGHPALVMTSGNLSDEPIAFDDQDALERLNGVADLFIVHDREIATRTDDSVVRTVGVGDRRQRLCLRRSRGYVPAPVTLPVAPGRPLLACGAEQKNTFCVARDQRAFVSHHIGDLEHYVTLEAFRHGVEHFERMFSVSPELLVHDLHPEYLSTKYASERVAREDLESMAVQHHHAHLAATLAEHGRIETAVGAIYDGTGYGSDATIWGGELLVGNLAGYERAGRLWTVRMPGGSAAIRQPWRMAWAWLAEAFGEPRPPSAALARLIDSRRWAAMAQVGVQPSVSPLTSSMGRLFDAVAALCGLAAEVSYEGQAAVELEAAASRSAGSEARSAGYEIELLRTNSGLVLDPRRAVRGVAADLEAGRAVPTIAAGFHDAVARATVTALSTIAAARGTECMVLSGGVFQNRLLLEAVGGGVTQLGAELLIARQLPPGDGGIAFGQAAVAAARQP
ncbi:MAG: carbamoyltransferase HypF [Actinomycetota bacterium]|nr:carbamoyltransferase HypF [Actinomycetota bacterium]